MMDGVEEQDWQMLVAWIIVSLPYSLVESVPRHRQARNWFEYSYPWVWAGIRETPLPLTRLCEYLVAAVEDLGPLVARGEAWGVLI